MLRIKVSRPKGYLARTILSSAKNLQSFGLIFHFLEEGVPGITDFVLSITACSLKMLSEVCCLEVDQTCFIPSDTR